MGLSGTLIYPSEVILCSTICEIKALSFFILQQLLQYQKKGYIYLGPVYKEVG